MKEEFAPHLIAVTEFWSQEKNVMIEIILMEVMFNYLFI